MASLIQNIKNNSPIKGVSSFAASYSKDVVLELLRKGYFDDYDPEVRDSAIKGRIEEYARMFEGLMR